MALSARHLLITPGISDVTTRTQSQASAMADAEYCSDSDYFEENSTEVDDGDTVIFSPSSLKIANSSFLIRSIFGPVGFSTMISPLSR